MANAMNIFLHIGAHRCATTSFQSYLRQNATRLTVQGTGFWGPLRTRGKLFAGVLPSAGDALRRNRQIRARGRVQIAISRAAESGLENLIVSDENVLGSVRANLRLCGLYDGVGERLARFNAAFDGKITQLALSVRALDTYWASGLGYSLTRGCNPPRPGVLTRITDSPRSWRDVITDVACAVPGARLIVLPHERFAGRPDAMFSAITGTAAPKDLMRQWRNATPLLPELRALLPKEQAGALPGGEGRWYPFDAEQAAILRERYADDILWLTGGADGLATLAHDPDTPTKTAGPSPQDTYSTRGRPYDDEERRLAGTG